MMKWWKSLPERELRMLWEVKKDDRRSFLIGTAHFFPYSFRSSLSRCIVDASTVIFEGPLDAENSEKVVRAGTSDTPGSSWLDTLDIKTREAIAMAVSPFDHNRFSFLRFDHSMAQSDVPLRELTWGMKPWRAFFTVWRAFLAKKGWSFSVDVEAYDIAGEMGKRIVFLETIDEQIEVLEGLSQERMRDFLTKVEQWDVYAHKFVKYYLKGEAEKLRSATGMFPTRRFTTIGKRDRVFFERMIPYVEEGNAVVCVGVPHIPGVCNLLGAAGYEILGGRRR